MSLAEMMWMNEMLEQDDREAFEEKKALVEYLAAFINPEAVREIRNMANNTKQVSDEGFLKTLEQLAGKELDGTLLGILNKG